MGTTNLTSAVAEFDRQRTSPSQLTKRSTLAEYWSHRNVLHIGADDMGREWPDGSLDASRTGNAVARKRFFVIWVLTGVL